MVAAAAFFAAVKLRLVGTSVILVAKTSVLLWVEPPRALPFGDPWF